MKMRGAWVYAVKFMSVVTLLSGVVLVAVFAEAGKRNLLGKTGSPTTVTSQAAKPGATRGNSRWAEAYGRLPMSFEENQGQTASKVRYVSHASGYELFLTPQEAVLALRPNQYQDLSPLRRAAFIRAMRRLHEAERVTEIRMQLEGANPEPQIAGLERLPGKVNYLIGNDPKKWHTDVPTYARVKYAEVYPGVDLVFYGNQRRLEYDFVVAPGADPKAIQLKIDGARKMRIDSSGDLVLSVANGEVKFQKPLVFQNVNGEKRELAGGYAIAADNRVTFAVPAYDRSEPLILDPVLNYSTYLGGSGGDGGFAIAVDAAGDAFIAGQTMSTDFPAGTHGAVSPSPSPNMGASFVAELNPAGTQLLYSTYLAGTASNAFEQAFGVAVDASGKIYVTGFTFATDFPTNSTIAGFKPGPDPTNVNGTSYIAKLDPAQSGAASLLYSSYIGGTDGTSPFGGDGGQAVAVDSSNPANGIAYVVGYTDSTPSTTVSSLTNFPIVNGFQPTLNTPNGNAFLAKIDTTKSGSNSLIYSTYLGGTGANAAVKLGFGEFAFGVAVDATGNAYFAGATTSTDFPTFGTAHQPTAPAGNTQGTAFVTQIDTTKVANASGIYSTYLGGATFDQAFAIALGPGKVAYVTGTTSSNDFPVTPKPGAFDTSGAGVGKAFVSLIDTTKAASPSLTYSTFLGGSGGDTSFGIKVDAAGNAYVAGTTSSSDFPFPPKSAGIGGFEPTYPAGALSVGFFSKLNPAGGRSTDLLYSTFFGGGGTASAGDHIFAIAIDSSNPANAYVTGQTFSSSATFPVFPATAFQTTLNGTSDAFVAKLTPIPTMTIAPAPGTTINFGSVLIGTTSPAQTVTLTDNTNSTISFTGAALSGTNAADYAVTTAGCTGGIVVGTPCVVSIKFTPTAPAATEVATLTITDGDSTSPQVFSLTGTGLNALTIVPAPGTTIDFGTVQVGQTSAAQRVTLTNNTSSTISFTSAALSGTNAADYAVTTAGCTGGIVVGTPCVVSATFKPTVAAPPSEVATLTITDGDSTSPQMFQLTGKGSSVPPPDFTLGAAPTTLTVAQGAVGSSVTITVNPTNGFASAVALTCAGAPAYSSCVLNPASITPPTTSTITFTAHAMLVPMPISKPAPPFNVLRIVPLFVALMLLFLLRSAQRLRMRLAMVTAILVCVTLAACSSGYNGPTKTMKGTYPLTVTGTSGALTHTTTVTVTVN